MSKLAAKCSLFPPPLSSSSSSLQLPPSLCEFGKIASFTIIPYGVSLLGWYVIPPRSSSSSNARNRWLKKVNGSCFRIISDPSYVNALESVIVSPMGYALFLVTKNGIQEEKMALGLFGGTMFLYLGGIYTFTRVKSTKCWIGNSSLIAISALVTAGAFGRVNSVAGWCMFPFAVWMTHQAIEIVCYHFKRGNAAESQTV